MQNSDTDFLVAVLRPDSAAADEMVNLAFVIAGIALLVIFHLVLHSILCEWRVVARFLLSTVRAHAYARIRPITENVPLCATMAENQGFQTFLLLQPWHV